MEKWWNERYINRRDYILEHVETLALCSDESLLLLLIDYMNEHAIAISHNILAEKMKKDGSEIDELLSVLSKKGYLQITYQDKKIVFLIDGVFEQPKEKIVDLDESLFNIYESEFARPLTPIEMQRLSDWSQTYNQQLIVYALREALVNHVRNFDYIDRILQEWKKRNFSAQDYVEGKR